jgi:hypothetical protein
MAEPLFWQNRIVESGAASPQELAKGMHPLNWRGHPENQREALEEALDSLGILQPVLFNRQSGRVIDGHLRIELAVLKGQPLIPVNYVELTDDEEALALATLDAITEQAQPIPEKLAALLERTREMTADKPGLGAMLEALRSRAADGLLAGNGNGENGNYVRNIESPEYIPTGDKPATEQLFDTSTTDKLINEIDASDIPEQEKDFLRKAAQRHTIFNFKHIAEYYAHSNEEMQELMENSALVIIDFNKAISLGFVQLTQEIAELVREEYGDDD